jgi:hypothetical protein
MFKSKKSKEVVLIVCVSIVLLSIIIGSYYPIAIMLNQFSDQLYLQLH